MWSLFLVGVTNLSVVFLLTICVLDHRWYFFVQQKSSMHEIGAHTFDWYTHILITKYVSFMVMLIERLWLVKITQLNSRFRYIPFYIVKIRRIILAQRNVWYVYIYAYEYWGIYDSSRRSKSQLMKQLNTFVYIYTYWIFAHNVVWLEWKYSRIQSDTTHLNLH